MLRVNKQLRPFFPFYGSKWNTARYYPPPQGPCVVEPFAGSAGYSTFYGVERAVLLDADPIITGVWRYLVKVKRSEILSLPLMENPELSVDDFKLPEEARHLIGFWLNRGSATPKKRRTAFSARTERGQLVWGERARARIANQVERIRGWQVQEASYESAPQGDTTFVDPPYECKGKFYRVRFKEFDALSYWCRARLGHTIVCENEGAAWLPFQPLGKFKATRGCSTEVLWTK